MIVDIHKFLELLTTKKSLKIKWPSDAKIICIKNKVNNKNLVEIYHSDDGHDEGRDCIYNSDYKKFSNFFNKFDIDSDDTDKLYDFLDNNNIYIERFYDEVIDVSNKIDTIEIIDDCTLWGNTATNDDVWYSSKYISSDLILFKDYSLLMVDGHIEILNIDNA